MDNLALLFLLALLCGCVATAPHTEASKEIAEQFVLNDSTYRFDGMAESFRHVSGPNEFASPNGLANSDCSGCFVFEFDSRHGGYGDRTGMILIQMITHHIATVIVENGKVTGAIMDAQWDMVEGKMLENSAPAEGTIM